MRRFHVMPVMIAAICSALASAGWSADKDDEDNPTFKVVLHPAAAARPRSGISCCRRWWIADLATR